MNGESTLIWPSQAHFMKPKEGVAHAEQDLCCL